MGEVNGSLRALLIQSRPGLSSLAREMAERGMISDETLSRLTFDVPLRPPKPNGNHVPPSLDRAAP